MLSYCEFSQNLIYRLELDRVFSMQVNRILGSVWYLVVCVLHASKLPPSGIEPEH